ncbi:MAG TPA: S8 family serine peptidase, partial [Thermoguttaceae bacterium]|nr:S8 family serine peptidase [Thermoguttaceae bacterium]
MSLRTCTMEAFIMRQSPRRLSVARCLRLESMEPRMLLSAAPLGDYLLDHLIDDAHATEVCVNSLEAHGSTAGHELTGLDDVWTDYGLTGSGQTVVVIDSGIAYDHVDLGAGFGSGYQVVAGFDFTGERDGDPYDDGPAGGHGTHVAGVIAGETYGVAPGVDLVGLRVFDDSGYGEFAWVEEALQWVHDNRSSLDNPITTVNLSLGVQANSELLPEWTMLEDELAQLEADGIFISVAAGNAFATLGEPGLSYPAASSHVVPVGSVDADGSLSFFSQRDVRMIAAPGRSILSTVPDYAGNHNGLADDFVRYSGTSMAGPYVAGAAALLREAYAFAGMDRVTQEDLYGVMFDTADVVHDAETGLDYRRLNLHRAIDTIMPADDFASDPGAAYALGTISHATSLSGAIAKLDDFDWFTFTAGETGTLTLDAAVTGDLLPRWELAASSGYAMSDSGETFSIEVIAGESYTVGLATGDGLGYYTLGLEIESSVETIDFGTVMQERFEGNRIGPAGQWFTVTAATAGLLTVEAMFNHADGDVDFQLFDADHQLLGTSEGLDNLERIDVTAQAGETFLVHAYVYGGGSNGDVDLRITNLVRQVGQTLFVSGTDGDDQFAFAAGATHQVSVNDVAYQFASADIDSIRIDGRSGADTAILVGTSGNEEAVLRVNTAQMTGPGYQVLTTNVETATVRAGGGSDRVVFYDSVGNDSFLGAPTYAQLSGDSFQNRADGFDVVDAYATAGGVDVAKLLDSPGDDQFVATPTYAELRGETFRTRVRFFDGVHAYATAGGVDTAKLFDSIGDDTFYADPIAGALFGDGFYNRAKYFEGV